MKIVQLEDAPLVRGLEHRGGTFHSRTTAEGVPEGGVLSIEADADGAIWMATGRGVARFDGTTDDWSVLEQRMPARGSLPGSSPRRSSQCCSWRLSASARPSRISRSSPSRREARWR